jgi:hypothetical protein
MCTASSRDGPTAAQIPGAEAERLARRPLEREVVAGVEHFKPGQHHATIEARDAEDFFDPTERGDIGRVTYVDQMGHLCVVLTWRDTGSDEWRATWIGRTGMIVNEEARRAPEGFELSEKMLAALREADQRAE